MEVLVSQFFSSGLAPSTQGTYASAKCSYLSFCLQHNLPPIPASQHTTCLFAAHLASKGLRPSSISAYLAALRHLQIEVGAFPPPRGEWPQLQYVMRGIKRLQNTHHKKIRLPITSALMGKMQPTIFSARIPWPTYDKTMIWAACCMGFFGFMRSGEFTSSSKNQASPISVGDIAVDSHCNPSMIQVFLAKAKTDPFGKGVHIYLGKTDMPVCRVTLLSDPPSRPGSSVYLVRQLPLHSTATSQSS